MINLLIVDSNVSDHQRYQTLLKDSEVVFTYCADGTEALRRAKQVDGPVHVVVILWELAGSPSGAELLTLLRRQYPTLPVLMVSESLDWSRASAARAMGASDFLLKPLERDRFRRALDRA